MPVDININDILMDPSLDDEVEDDGIVKSPVPYAEKIPSPPSNPKPQVVKEPDFDIRAEIAKAAEREAGKQLIINDPSSLLDGSINPMEIVNTLITDPTKNDPLCIAIDNNTSVNDLYNKVMKEIAEELAYLKAYRKIHYLSNEDISDVSLKRVKALKNLIDTLVEKEKLKNSSCDGKIDFGGEKFEKVMEFILTKVRETFEKVGIPEQFNDIFFIQLAQNLEGFEKKVEKIYYGTAKK